MRGSVPKSSQFQEGHKGVSEEKRVLKIKEQDFKVPYP